MAMNRIIFRNFAIENRGNDTGKAPTIIGNGCPEVGRLDLKKLNHRQ